MTETPQRNEELFRAIARQIEEHPESHDQFSWNVTWPGCGTKCCIAGWAVSLAGYQFSSYGFAFVAGNEDYVGCLAEELLGLGGDEADRLFDAAWQPAHHLTVPEALEKLAAGASIDEVSA